MIGQSKVVQWAMFGVVQFQLVFSLRQSFKQDFQPVVAAAQARGLHFLVVDPELELIQFLVDPLGVAFDGDQNAATADLICRAG